MLADHRMTSVRQQSDQLLSLGGKKIASSPLTVFRQREKVRMKTVQEVEEQLGACNFRQLCCDGRVVVSYVLVGQFLAGKLIKTEAIIAVKFFYVIHL